MDDQEYLSRYQKECMFKMGQTLQLEQQAYLEKHPEVNALLSLMLSKAVREGHRKSDLSASIKFLVQPTAVLDKEIRQYLELPPTGCYTQNVNMKLIDNKFKHKFPEGLEIDLNRVKLKEFPTDILSIPPSSEISLTTLSSSFLTIQSSDTTLPTPEPTPIPEPTIYDILLAMVSNAVDKACFLHVTEDMLLYDTAYVEIKKMIEAAMEVPIVEIRLEIACIFERIYKAFEEVIIAEEMIAAEIAWEKRMRKKMKRTQRRVKNFRGYESPPTVQSSSSDDSTSIVEQLPPAPPCVCHPQYNYNRYPKDRFGIYLPQEVKYCDVNVTVTPTISDEYGEENKEHHHSSAS